MSKLDQKMKDFAEGISKAKFDLAILAHEDFINETIEKHGSEKLSTVTGFSEVSNSVKNQLEGLYNKLYKEGSIENVSVQHFHLEYTRMLKFIFLEYKFVYDQLETFLHKQGSRTSEKSAKEVIEITLHVLQSKKYSMNNYKFFPQVGDTIDWIQFIIGLYYFHSSSDNGETILKTKQLLIEAYKKKNP